MNYSNGDMNMKRETTSIKIDPVVWRRFKANCAKNGWKISDTLEALIVEYLGKVEE